MTRGLTFKKAEALAELEVKKRNADVFIYRLPSGRFGITTNKRTIPLSASIHATIAAPIPNEERHEDTVSAPDGTQISTFQSPMMEEE